MKKKKVLISILFIAIGMVVFIFGFFMSAQVWSSASTSEDSAEPVVRPSFEPISDQASGHPFFMEDPNWLFFQDYDDNLIRIDLTDRDFSEKKVASLPGDSASSFVGGDSWGLMEWSFSPETPPILGKLNPKSYQVKELREDAWGGSWTPDDRITFLQSKEGISSLWQMRDNGSGATQLLVLDNLSSPSSTAWSPAGDHLLIRSSFGTSVYSMQGETLFEYDYIEYSRDATWSPDGTLIAYRVFGEDRDSLWIKDMAGGNSRQVYESVFSEVNWLPDGRLVFFTVGKEGGAACWALDPISGVKELLADSSLVIYKPIGTIAISPTGKAIAFKAQDEQIWLLSIP